jgi:hypothetical protein
LGKVVAGIVRDPQKNIYDVLEGIAKLDGFLNSLMKISQDFNTRKS